MMTTVCATLLPLHSAGIFTILHDDHWCGKPEKVRELMNNLRKIGETSW